MFKTLGSAFKNRELRKGMLITLLLLLVYRLGCFLPTPGLSADFYSEISANDKTGLLGLLNTVTGSALSNGAFFALGVTPYINASIIVQLLTVAIPALERLSKEGGEGRKKLNKITKYAALAIAVFQAWAYYLTLKKAGAVRYTEGFDKVFSEIVIIFCFAAGASLVVWLGDQINESGIGNGISMILFAGIIARVPSEIIGLIGGAIDKGTVGAFVLVGCIGILFLAMIAFIIYMNNAERRIPVQYAKRVVGRKMYGGQSTHIPIKVNMSGVLPVIFASSILSLPPTIEMFLDEDKITGTFWETFFGWFSTSHWVYSIIYFFLILFFAYFYASIQYNPVEMANNIRKNSGMIPGLRPGKPTADYIKKILGRITLLGALMLSVVALFPNLLTMFTKLIGWEIEISLGGTSLIIVVGVALETVKQLESQMMMRHYKGFLD